MGKRTFKAPGVRQRGRGIQLRFQFRTQRCEELLRMEPTLPNLRYAAELLDTIERKIANGTFNYAEFFPESKRAATLGATPAAVPSFRQLAEKWLRASAELATGTLKGYRQLLGQYWYPTVGDKPVNEIRYSDLAELVGKVDWPSARTRNNALIPLRAVLEFAYVDGLVAANVAAPIKNQKRQPPMPDPFTPAEIELILADMKVHYHEQILNYFEFAFFTGVRPEEQIPLRWADVDWHGATVRIDKAFTCGEEKPTKTHKARDVDLNARAMAALKRQRAHTQLAGGHIFHHPGLIGPWTDERSQRRTFWHPSLARIGLRRRRAYCTRHTYATLALMSGQNPMYVAAQLGHSVQVLLRDYTKWLNGADNGRERQKLDHADWVKGGSGDT